MPSEVKVTAGTTYKVNGEAGADYAWSMEGVSDGAGRVSAQIDLGSGDRDFVIDWSCEVLFQASPTQYDTLDLYIASAPEDDSTQIDGDVGASDAALGDLDQLRNLQYIGSVVAEEADTSKMVASGSFVYTKRYLSFVGHNDAGAAINATDSNFIFKFTVRTFEGQ